MKRSERFQRQARQRAGWMLVCISMALAGAVWAWQLDPAPCWTVAAMAGVALILAILHGREAARLHVLADDEAHWDSVRAIRPKL